MSLASLDDKLLHITFRVNGLDGYHISSLEKTASISILQDWITIRHKLNAICLKGLDNASPLNYSIPILIDMYQDLLMLLTAVIKLHDVQFPDPGQPPTKTQTIFIKDPADSQP